MCDVCIVFVFVVFVIVRCLFFIIILNVVFEFYAFRRLFRCL